MQLPTILMMCLALTLTAPTDASAEGVPVLKVRSLFEPAKPRPIFETASLAAAQVAQAATTSTNPNVRQFGVGLRLGPDDFGIGGSVRYFFYGGPLGIQAEVSRNGVDLGSNDFSTVRFTPAAIYRFVEYEFDGPVSLTPYVGGGFSIIHSRFDEEDDLDDFDDDTSFGILLLGGVEIFFSNVPNIGVSGELQWVSNDDIDGASFGPIELGGVAFTAAGHWYFW